MQPNFDEMFMGEEHQPFHWDAQGNNEERKVALLIHGFPGTPAEMRPIGELLHGQGWSVRGVLLPGFGQDFEHILERRHEDWLGSVGADLYELKRNYDKVVVIGFSMGGALAINLASRHEVDGLVLFSPFVKIDHVLWKALPLVSFVLPTVKIFKIFKPDFEDAGVRDGIHNFMPNADLDNPEVREQILETELPISMFNEIRQLGEKAYDRASQVRVSPLIIQGRDDDLVRPTRTRELIRQFQVNVLYEEVDAKHEILDPALGDWGLIEAKLLQYVGWI